MSLDVCIPDLLAQGLISKQVADEALALYEERLGVLASHASPSAAKAMASEQAFTALQGRMFTKKRQIALKAESRARILQQSAAYPGADTSVAARFKGLMAHIAHDPKAGFANVEYQWRAIKNDALRMMYGTLKEARNIVTGKVRTKGDFLDVVRELHGMETDNLNAKEMAEAIRKMQEYLRLRFNAAGGHILKLEDYGLQHSHDSQLAGAAGPEAWIDFVVPLLDRERMIDRDTSFPFSEEKLRLALRDVWETIRSDGRNRTEPRLAKGENPKSGKGALANSRGEQRFLHFKNADGWLSYQDRFGGEDPLSGLLSHIDRMSRDIATMEILGPNPRETVEWMKSLHDAEAHMKGGVFDRIDAWGKTWRMDQLYNELMGANRRPVVRELALFATTLRNWQNASKLGGSMLTSLSDEGTIALTRAYNGLQPLTATYDHFKQMFAEGDRDFARRHLIISEELIGHSAGQARNVLTERFGMTVDPGKTPRGYLLKGLEHSAEMSRRMADTQQQIGMTNHWTMTGRETMAMEFWSTLTALKDKPLAELNPALQGFFQRYGLSDTDWNSVRQTPLIQHKGADWIVPDNINDHRLRDAINRAVLSEIDYAVPTPGLRQRAMVNAVPSGTGLGDLIKAGYQYKMFPLTVFHKNLTRAMATRSYGHMALYLGAEVAMTTAWGAVALWAYDVSRGRDPRSIDAPDFLKQAVLKGGGLGPYGDLIALSTNEFGSTVGDITAGPSFGTIQNVADFAYGKVDPETGERRHDLARFMQRETPFGSNFWTRLLFERLVIDNVRAWQDPEWDSHAQTMIDLAREQGRPFYAEPGAPISQWRAPDPSNLVAEVPEE